MNTFTFVCLQVGAKGQIVKTYERKCSDLQVNAAFLSLLSFNMYFLYTSLFLSSLVQQSWCIYCTGCLPEENAELVDFKLSSRLNLTSRLLILSSSPILDSRLSVTLHSSFTAPTLSISILSCKNIGEEFSRILNASDPEEDP